ncbi:unnamed protein product [Ceutorhynchus assimilis]|uniref:Pacifastin domain-containing protein n=1 Tax=Ceutorhynchus assimilis TaxID=467358 RepID=A0A9N9MPN3_9CUCU|nr:unnamed protein product [Ceutorhynchus assimilis]
MNIIVLFGFLLLSATNSNAQNYRHHCRQGEIAPMDNRGEKCTCLDGRWACTSTTTSAPVTNCVPDENIDYTDFCGCFCLDGWWACADCFPPDSTSTTESSTIDCQEGQTTSFDNGCNTCHCTNGMWACTEKLCLTTTATSTTTNTCEDGAVTSFDGCNKCTCMNGVWGCTKIFCQTTTVKPQCKEGQTTFDGCNNCFCSNGIWACTLKFCFETTTPTTEEECEEGETKALDSCNNCFCTNGFWSCTRIACPPNTNRESTTESLSTRVPRKCKPGSGKIEDCNRCYCTETGIWIYSKMTSCNNN